jgi:hypothetical protein
LESCWLAATTNGTAPHTPGTTVYYLSYGSPNPSGTQAGWRYCSYCKELFWGNEIANSVCPVVWNFANEKNPNPNHTPVGEAAGGPVDGETDYNPYIQ